jgi:hypothetical protein
LSLWREVEELHTLLGESIDARSGRAAQRTTVIRTEFTHTEIVDEEIDHVWLLA